MDTATFASRLAADHAFVNFDRVLPADGVALRSDHAGAELVEYLKGGLVTGERKLALELNRRLSGDLCGHEIRAPKPRRERRVAGLHDRTSCQRRVGLAATAAQHYRRTCGEAVRLTGSSALGADKPTWPADGLKVAGASRIVREDPLKLWKRRRKTANVHEFGYSRSRPACQATG
jgi:hypothetical protein